MPDRDEAYMRKAAEDVRAENMRGSNLQAARKFTDFRTVRTLRDTGPEPSKRTSRIRRRRGNAGRM